MKTTDVVEMDVGNGGGVLLVTGECDCSSDCELHQITLLVVRNGHPLPVNYFLYWPEEEEVCYNLIDNREFCIG